MKSVARTTDKKAVEKFVSSLYHTNSFWTGNTKYHCDHYILKTPDGKTHEVGTVTKYYATNEYLLRVATK